jgi:predicted SnoaL-like aldol condensation-catalyzing enzyme
MKQILSLFAIGALFALVSCGSNKTEKTAGETMTDKKDNSMAEKNLAAMHAVNNAFETGNTAGLDSVIAGNFIDHSSTGDKVGVDSLKAMITWMRADSKDMKMEITKELADDEYAMAWMHFTGTSNGAMGKPGPYDMKAVEVAKFKDGKAVEHWEFMEMQDVMKMMAPPPAKMDDNSKMKSK